MGSLLQIPRLKPEENWNEWFYYFQAIGDTINEVTTESESISGIASELIVDIASLNNDVDGINLILFNQAGQINSIISSVNNVEGDVTGLISITGGLNTRITNNENNISGLVAITGGLDTRISTNENNITFLGGISGDHETRITDNENNISGLVSISGDHESRIIGNENNITALIEITGQFSTDITNISDNITGLQTISGDHEDRLDDAELSIESLSLTVQSFAGGLIDIYTNTIGITGGLDQLDDRFVFLTDFIAISGDHENRITNNENDIAGLVAISGDHEGRITQNENDIVGLVAISGDHEGRITQNENNITSLIAITGDHEGRIDTIETYTEGITGGLDQLDDRFVNVTGDTMTGDLTLDNASSILFGITGSEIGSISVPLEKAHVRYLCFEPNGDHVHKEGLVYWDFDDKTLSLDSEIDDVKLQVGQESWIRVTNKTGSTILNGKVVYIDGAQGNRPTVDLANNNSDVSGKVIGVTTHDIENNETGYITTFGLVRGINTSGWDEGDILYLDVNGIITNAKPTEPLYCIRVGFALNSTNNGSILVNIKHTDNIGDLNNVVCTNPANDEILSFNASISAWECSTRLTDLETYTEGITGGLDQLDDRFVNVTGDTMTGALIINGSSDTNQLKIKDHSTQTSPTILLNDSTDTEKLRIHSNYSTNLFVGKETGLNNSPSTTTGDKATFIGQEAGRALTTARNCTLIGYRAGRRINTGGDNTCVGSQAGDAITTGTGNVALGYYSLPVLTTGHRNFALGTGALQAATTAEDNTCIGGSAGERITTGTFNLALGSLTMRYITTGGNNIAIGANAMRDHGLNTGEYNVGVGRDALRYAGGSSSVAIGTFAGGGAGTPGTPSTSSLNNNTFIGFESGRYNTGSSNVFIGYNSGKNSTGSNQLYIDNTSTDTPLIFGDFTSRRININGDLRVPSDTYKFYIGAGGDYSLGYDGTNLNLKSVVGASDFVIDCGTEKTLVLEQPVWDDIQFVVESGRSGVANFPDWDTITTNTAAYKFDVNDYIDLGTQELKHDWKEGSTIHPHIHTALDGGNASGNSQYAKFTLYMSYADEGEVYTEIERNIEVEIPDGTTDRTHLFGSTSVVDISGATIGTQVNMRLKRIAATTGTEYPNHIFITQVGLHYQVNSLGSRQIGTK